MLPELVWDMPPMGTINLHGSLLPQYRGAAPINWAIINGEKQTGVTTFKLLHEIDTGNILLQQAFEIGDEETAGEVHDRMKIIGAFLLLKTIEGLAKGDVKEHIQEPTIDKLNPNSEQEFLKDVLNNTFEKALQHAPKIFTETCEIDWAKPVDEVYNLIRGLSPYPTAFTFLEGKKLKIFKVGKTHRATTTTPGKFETDKKDFLEFACANGYISIKELQLEGKKKMTVADFLRGYRWP